MAVVDVQRSDRRFEVLLDGEVAGFAEFEDDGGRRSFTHTVVDERFQGRGLAGRLIGDALDATRQEGLAVEPHCSYVRTFVLEHPEHLDLVEAESRFRFDLPAAD